MLDNISNVAIERTLLKALYTQPENIYTVTDVLGTTSNHFLDDNNRAAYEVLLKLYDQGKEFSEFNFITILGNKIGKAQANTHLVKILSAMPTTKPVDVAYSIIDQSAKRRIYMLGEMLRKKAASVESHQDILSDIDKEIREITQEATTHGAKSLSKIVENFYTSIQQKINPLEFTTFSTGIKEFDDVLKGGFVPGQFTVLAARPSMGKTMLATQLAMNFAKQNIACAIFSLEMTQNELMMRLINQMAGKDVVGSKEDILDNADMVNAMLDLHSLPIHIDDAGRLDLITLKTKARRLIKNENVKVIVIDYLQLMTGPQHQSREREVAELSKGLKSMAKELEVPIICLAQLNRGVEQRESKIPVLSDLRESGAIEQDADVVVFIHRKKYYDDSADNKAQIIFAKNRTAGITANVGLEYDKTCGLFK